MPLYLQTSHTVWLENRPDMMKLHHRLLPEFRRDLPEAVFMMSVGQLHTYIELDWEIGITNEFKVMQDQGITKAQLMEIVMSAQVYAGIRGLEGVYRATWPFIKDFQDRPVEKSPFPSDWDYDVSHFKAGLDLSTRELTDRRQVAPGGVVPAQRRRNPQVGHLHGQAPAAVPEGATACAGKASSAARCRASACRG